jgi:ABC-type uncharacterized transport system permease subunit
MSGYASGIIAILCINLIFAYAIFVTAAAGQLNLGGAGFQAIGGYAAATLSNYGWSAGWATIPAAMVFTALVGFLISFPVLRTRGVYMVLATFAFGEVVSGFLLQSNFFGGAVGLVVPDYLPVSVLIGSAVVATLVVFFLMATRFGLALRAIHDDEAVATVMGVNVRAAQVAVFTIGGALAGLSGALYAPFQLRRAAVFQLHAFHLRAAVRAHWWRANRLGAACGQPVLHACAGVDAHRGFLALRGVRRRDRADDGHTPGGHDHPRARRSVDAPFWQTPRLFRENRRAPCSMSPCSSSISLARASAASVLWRM